MNELELAGLKRKYLATQELAKRAELRAVLVRAGVDPDAVEKPSEPSRAKSAVPEGRSTKPLVTAEPTKPVDKAEVTSGFLSGKPEVKEPVVKTSPASRRRPARPRTAKAEDK